jgi:hypothetical protein
VTQAADRLVIDRVIVNSKLDDNTFTPPAVPLRHGGRAHTPGGASGMPGNPGAPFGPNP